jgi:hypothetical protein
LASSPGLGVRDELVAPLLGSQYLAAHRPAGHLGEDPGDTRANTPPARIRDTLADVISLVDKGAMTVPEGRPFPLDQAAPATEAAEAPAHGGKPLLIFN